MSAVGPHLLVGVLLTNPGEELFHTGVRLELVDGVEVGGELFVRKQRMDLLVAGLADVGGGANVLLFAFSLLTGDEVVNSELGAGAIAQLTHQFLLSTHRILTGDIQAMGTPPF